MSRADVLLCPKVAALICQHLSPGSHPIEEEHDKDILNARREGREALASLARVCRGVSSLALDALWACIDDFRDLLSVFEVYSPAKSMFTGVFTDAEWLRFQSYALRIRELHAGELDRVHSTVWITLTRRSLQGPLLPYLQRLTGLNLTSESLPYTMLFSPTIRHLDLTVDAAAERGIIRMVLQELQPALAFVRTLVVTEPACDLRSTAPAVEFWKCTQLRTLKVMRSTPITREMLDSLASMENLHTLHLHIKSMPSYSQNENPTGFSKLDDLALWGRLTDVCAFLTATKPPNLQVLAIEIRRLCDDTRGGHGGAAALCSLEPVYASLAPSLHHFSAVLCCDCDDIYHFLDSEKVLVPLSAFRELRDVSFVFEGSKFHLSDAALAEVVDAWPELVAFTISKRPRVIPKSNRNREVYIVHYRYKPLVPRDVEDHPTIKTLAAFARAHSRLERLTIPSIDLDAVPDVDTVPPLQHKLRHFRVDTLAPKVALFEHALALDRLFPELDLAAARGNVPNGSAKSEDRNGELQLLLLALQTGRLAARCTGAVEDEEGPSEVRMTLRGRYLEPRGRPQVQPAYPHYDRGPSRGPSRSPPHRHVSRSRSLSPVSSVTYDDRPSYPEPVMVEPPRPPSPRFLPSISTSPRIPATVAILSSDYDSY